MFVVGDEENVLKHSRPLTLDPLAGHEAGYKGIDNPNMRETIKELAQLDGAFIVSNEGVVLSSTPYLDAHGNNIDLPLGLGSRHIAAASISQETDAVAVVVSENSVVRVLDDGKLIAEIIPELWLLQRVRSTISQPDIAEIKEEENVAHGALVHVVANTRYFVAYHGPFCLVINRFVPVLLRRNNRCYPLLLEPLALDDSHRRGPYWRLPHSAAVPSAAVVGSRHRSRDRRARSPRRYRSASQRSCGRHRQRRAGL